MAWCRRCPEGQMAGFRIAEPRSAKTAGAAIGRVGQTAKSYSARGDVSKSAGRLLVRPQGAGGIHNGENGHGSQADETLWRGAI